MFSTVYLCSPLSGKWTGEKYPKGVLFFPPYVYSAHSPPSGSPDVREEAISPLTADRRPQSPPAEEEAEEEGSCPLGVEGSEESGGRGDGGRVGEGEGSLRAGEDTTMSGGESGEELVFTFPWTGFHTGNLVNPKILVTV